MDMLLLILFSTTALAWVVVAAGSTVGVLQLRNLPGIEEVEVRARRPSAVSVIIAARNEEDRIEKTVQGLLAQQDVDLALIVVNDRSTDATAAILDRLEKADDRLRVVHIDHLPEGWIGKCHALHVGTDEARGRWILFTDADVWMNPGVLARAVQAAEQEQAHHVCLMPRQREATLLGKASLLMLLLGMPAAFHHANRDKAGAGFGAFNLVRADALRDIGGYAALRMEVVDDHQLAALLYRAGKRTRAYFAGREVEMDFARTVADVVGAIEKNGFAILRYNTLLVSAMVPLLGVLLSAAVVGPVTGTIPGVLAGIAFLSLALPGGLLARKYEWSALAGLLAPIGLLVVLAAGLNSVVTTLLQRGVRWRDDFYPLDELREGMVR